MTTISNKIALVTGGSRGLGKDMALQLAKKGFNVVITYHSKQTEAENVVTEIKASGHKAYALQLDVAKSNSFDGFVANFKSILKSEFQAETFDALVNNAGVGVHADMSNTSEEQFDSMVNIHLKAPFFLTQKLFPLINKGGSIVNVASGLTRFSFTGYDAYAVMKGGVETLTRYQAKFLGDKGIRVNTLAPGAIETDFGGGAVRDNQDLNTMIAGMTALGRVGLPDDIGSVVAFLCSDDAKWVNAQRIEVSGGMLI
ncbi:SDR family NAD(P)-dependent oxidoreductase [Flavobacterium sp.]|uniref:SDR family NAD(P)-dependent oxidoreductase n=1 Tax=Flavobacterium sp. TaxID=239 RepID=UPI002FDB721B